MPYVPDWESLANARKRVMATGHNEQEANADICNAVADKKIRIRVWVDELDRDVGGKVLLAPNVEVPLRLNPEDFDWARSRPLSPWETGPTSVVEHYLPTWSWKPRRISLIEVSTADIASVLRDGKNSTLNEGARRGAAKTRAPDDERSQALADDAVRRVGCALFHENWIGSLTSRECWLIERYVERQQPASAILTGHVTFNGPGGPLLEVNDPALRAEAEAARDRRDWMNIQYDRVYNWLASHGFNIETDSLNTHRFERAFAGDFPTEIATGGAPVAAPLSPSGRSALSGWPRQRGRKPKVRETIAARMRSEIDAKSITKEQLETMLEKTMAERYGVSRDTARKARNDVLGGL